MNKWKSHPAKNAGLYIEKICTSYSPEIKHGGGKKRFGRFDEAAAGKTVGLDE